MTKKLVMVSLLLAGTSVFAAETSDAGKWFVGIGMTKGSGMDTFSESLSVPSQNYFSSDSYDSNYDTTSVPVTIGYITNSNNRAKLSFQTITVKADGGGEGKLKGMDFDFDWTIESIQNDKILPYVGIGIGSYTFVDSGELFSDNEDLVGASFNFNAGILYQANKNLELEIGYKHKTIQSEERTETGTYLGRTYTQTVDMQEQISSLYLGVNYKF